MPVFHDVYCHIDSDLRQPGTLASVRLYLLFLLSLLFPHPNGTDKRYKILIMRSLALSGHGELHDQALLAPGSDRVLAMNDSVAVGFHAGDSARQTRAPGILLD